MGGEKAHDTKYTTVSGGGGRVMTQVCMDASRTRPPVFADDVTTHRSSSN